MMLGLNVEKIKTDFGLINPLALKKHIKVGDILIYQNPAGYFAEQDIESIYNVCKKKCFVILDASGIIGKKDYSICCDISVCSFGEWKPVNAHYGGCVTSAKKEYFDKSKEIFNLEKFDEKYSSIVMKELKGLKKKYQLFESHVKKIKKDLKDYNVIHPKKWGINVVIGFSNEKEKKEIISYCEKHKYEYTICPRYIRVTSPAISIEVKRLK
jgi:dTDP-4-amino-4,6-dideoxygalactose transaminase